jgi:hypothetical protein
MYVDIASSGAWNARRVPGYSGPMTDSRISGSAKARA